MSSPSSVLALFVSCYRCTACLFFALRLYFLVLPCISVAGALSARPCLSAAGWVSSGFLSGPSRSCSRVPLTSSPVRFGSVRCAVPFRLLTTKFRL